MTDATDNAEPEITLEALIGVYLKMKAKHTALEQQAKDIDAQMRKVKLAINDKLRDSGLESAKTANGRVHRTLRTTYTTADWSAMHQFVLDHGAPELLEKRLHQSNMATFLTDNPGIEPPGLNVITEYSVTVTRNKS